MALLYRNASTNGSDIFTIANLYANFTTLDLTESYILVATTTNVIAGLRGQSYARPM